MRARLTPEEIVSIQVLVSKDVPVRDIARKLGKPESTVRHHARREGSDQQDGRQNKAAKCDEHASAIEAWVATHARAERPTNVRDLYEWLVAERGYDGSYKSVVRWARRHWGRPRVRTYRRVETPPGAQSQSDWGHFSPLIVAKEVVKPMAFVMTLSFSRRTEVAWSPSRELMAWIGCHNRTFERLGGVAATNRIDNEKTAIIEGAGAWGRIHPVYKAYSRQMRFHVDACGPRQPQAKGKAESKVKLTRTIAPSRAEYDSWEELEAETAQRLDSLAKRTRCPATGTYVHDAWEQERAFLGPLPRVLPKPFDVVVKRRVHRDGVFHFEGRQYNVPFHLVDRDVEVHGCERVIQVFADGSLVKEWPRGTPERLLIDPACYEGESTDRVLAPPPLGRLGQELQRIAAMPVEKRPIDLYAALAGVAR